MSPAGSSAPPARPPRSPFADHWALDPAVVFLNHGSFGACPRAVLDAQAALRAELEADPVRFLGRELDGRMAAARAAIGSFVGADPDDLALVPNATAGVNTVLRSLRLAPGDELLATDHEYNAALNALRFAAQRSGATIVTARIPLPVAGPEEAEEAVLAAVGPRTRLALLSHVTSPTALVLPVERLVPALESRGVAVLVDGAHAPGMIALDLAALGASYYAANLHKWVCAPKGAAFLHVRRDRQAAMRPLAISHGANDPRPGRSAFRKEFDWTGTFDPTPWLAAAVAIRVVGAMLDGGWPEVMARNRGLAIRARSILLAAIGEAAVLAGWGPPPALAPEAMLGSMAVVGLPATRSAGRLRSPLDRDRLQVALRDRFGIEAPVLAWPLDPGPRRPRRRLLRVSAHLHNSEAEYAHLGGALAVLLAGMPPGHRGWRAAGV